MLTRSRLFAVIGCMTLAACAGGGSMLPTASPNSPGTISAAAPNAKAATVVHESPAHDTLQGGVAIGGDGLIYAVGQAGLDQFTPSLQITNMVASAVPPDTWPVTIPKLSPTKSVYSSGTLINALATQPATTAAIASAAQPTFPVYVSFDTSVHQWNAPFVDNEPGHIFVDFVQNSPTFNIGPWIIGDEPNGSGGYMGFIAIPNATCAPPPFSFIIISLLTTASGAPVSPMPLGTGTFDNNGLVWLASDPSRNSNKPSSASNPSEIIEFDSFDLQVIQQIPLGAGSQINGMIVGPDGAIWFTDGGLNKIGRVATDGAIHYTDIPTPGAVPERITVGNDGALWFTELHGNKIGRITTAFAVSEFKTSPNAHPHGIIGCQAGSQCLSGSNVKSVFFTEDTNIGKVTF